MSRERFLENKKNRVKRVLEIEKFLESGHRLFKNDGTKQEALLHKSSKSVGLMQFTYFDEKGPVGDFQRDGIKAIAKEIYDYGFSPCEVSDLNILR